MSLCLRACLRIKRSSFRGGGAHPSAYYQSKRSTVTAEPIKALLTYSPERFLASRRARSAGGRPYDKGKERACTKAELGAVDGETFLWPTLLIGRVRVAHGSSTEFGGKPESFARGKQSPTVYVCWHLAVPFVAAF